MPKKSNHDTLTEVFLFYIHSTTIYIIIILLFIIIQ